MGRINVGLSGGQALQFVSLIAEKIAEGLVHIQDGPVPFGDEYGVR